MEKIRSLQLERGQIAIFWLGQNSYILKTPGGTSFAIDPYLTRRINGRYLHSEPPVKPEEFGVHFIFCTHDHSDHTDPEALPAIAEHSPNTVFFGPDESCEHLVNLGVGKNRVRALQAGIPHIARDLEVTAHYSIPPEEAKTTHFGYLFKVEGTTIYNMGDTYQGVVRRPETILDSIIEASPDIAMLPIVGDTPERKPEDAFLLAKLIKPRIAIPCHYGCFRDRTIDPRKFVQLFKETLEVKPIVIPYKGLYVYGG